MSCCQEVTGMTRRALLFCLLAPLLPGYGAAASAPLAYTCFRGPVAPVIDGVVEGDPGWQGIPAATGYHRLGRSYTRAKQTFVRVTWDDGNLYLGIIAEEPDIAAVKSELGDHGPLWLEDGVEVFVQPPDKQTFQFVVSAGGARTAWAGGADPDLWEAKVGRTVDSYSVEMRLAFDIFGLTPRDGSVWRANYCRNIFTTISGGDKFTTWAPLVTQFLEPEHFPGLRFASRALSLAECAEAEEALNARYRAFLNEQLAEIINSGDEYVAFLDRAVKSPRWQAEAEPLRAAWEEALAAQRGADSTPLLDLRRAVQRSEMLGQQSYQFKWRALLLDLLERD